MCVFRENTEDIYAGIEWEAGTPEAEKFYKFLKDELGVTKVRFPESSSSGVKPVSREGTESLVRAACQYALDHHLPSVTLVHKGNIMKFTEDVYKRQFRNSRIQTDTGFCIDSSECRIERG